MFIVISNHLVALPAQVCFLIVTKFIDLLQLWPRSIKQSFLKYILLQNTYHV